MGDKGTFESMWAFACQRAADDNLRERKRLEWLEEVGPPAFVFEDQGFWPAEWGVLVLPLRKNGYHPNEARRYESSFIEALIRAEQLPKPIPTPVDTEDTDL